MKILLIEDDDVVRDTIFSMLKYKEHDIDTTPSAEEALLRLPGDYDLVISDIMLQRMDGVTLLEAVNRMQRRIPVMMITGLGGSEIESICMSKGAAAFLQKPFSVHRFLSMVEDVGRNSYKA
jgi:DNA-binding NtrC family response regulator